jgi:peptide/nickel transport system ATP-binding protein/oligopeptide transport system ATP-binding protein
MVDNEGASNGVSTSTTTTTDTATNGRAPQADAKQRKVLLEVNNLVKYFPVRAGLMQRVKAWVKAVDDVSFHIYEGETLGLVGESGCGKTTVGRTILRLIPATSGEVVFDGRELFDLGASDLKKTRRDMQIIFQDPYSSLDPRMPVGESIAEGLRVHTNKSAQERYEIVVEMLTRVGMRAEHARRYPHEFSGGQRQRIGIARALALRPKFIVCDEPVSALDVSIQAQVLNILRELQRDFGLTYLFIAHNLSVVEHFSERVGVMYLGKMAEMAPRRMLYANPLHPYTQALMSAIPVPDPTLRRQRIILEGDVPSPLNPPSGCRFHTRCPIAYAQCSQEEPPFKDYGGGHYAACWWLETGEEGASKLTADNIALRKGARVST